jgi:hypothetical protein
MMLFEFKKGKTDWLKDVIDNYGVLKTANFDVAILASSDRGFRYKNEIHVWIGKEDYDNGNLMILLSYIILGHPDWKNGEIKIFAAFKEKDIKAEELKLRELTASGRLPISANNIRVLPLETGINKRDLINKHSTEADLTIIGFHEGRVRDANDLSVFEGYDEVGNILFVHTNSSKFI